MSCRHDNVAELVMLVVARQHVKSAMRCSGFTVSVLAIAKVALLRLISAAYKMDSFTFVTTQISLVFQQDEFVLWGTGSVMPK